jgi:DNA-binding transcriptional LysR family regulator
LSNIKKVLIDTYILSIGVMEKMVHSPPLARIQTFLAVAETLNFRRAAERLGVAQPALSRSVRQLEEHLGFALFERSTRRVALTSAGELLYREGAVALQRLSRACTLAERVAQGLSGSIMVGYSTFATSGPMSEIIIAFRKLFPDALVGLRLLASSEQLAALEDGSLDLGFMMSTVSLPPLEKIAISRERLVALIPAVHRWASRKSISLSELITAPLVIGNEGRWRGFRSLLKDIVDERGLSMKFVEEADDLPVLLQLVRSGFGCTILDASFIPTLPPGIRSVEIEDVAATLDVALTWHQDNLSSLAGHFIDVARRIASTS